MTEWDENVSDTILIASFDGVLSKPPEQSKQNEKPTANT